MVATLVGGTLLASCSQRSAITPGSIRVAVASNFAATLADLCRAFEAQSPYHVILVLGSTGKHYAQIHNGAPLDIFFAADARRPALLEREGLAVAGSRFTYAIGKLVLWSPQQGYVAADGEPLLPRACRHLAIANPQLAPYGRAAQEVLRARGLWETLRGQLVQGENIGQAFQFVESGNAEAGFVAYSQVKRPQQPIRGSLWLVPEELYSPIEQQVVLLQESAAAHAFLDFVRSAAAREILHGYGYSTP
jgi:molybdate transport system substrate-binding protein